MAAELQTLFPWVAGVLGLLLGSFLNVVIHRLPRMLQAEWKVTVRPVEATGWDGRALEAVAASGVLAEGAVAVAEGHWRDDPGEIAGLRRTRTARYGETGVWFYEPDGGA